MFTTITSTLLLSLFLVLTSSSVAEQQDTELPQLPLPRYNVDGTVQFLPRIVNGTPAYLGEFPGKVSIQNRAGAHFCGGTIVDTMHIVTAAHCVTNTRGQLTNPTTVQIMGDDLLITRQGSVSRQVRLVSHIFVHTGYNVPTFLNDIAVIRVVSPFNLTSTFYTVQRSATTPSENMVCRVAGWGATFEDGDASARLLRVDLPIVNTNTCNRAFGGLIRTGMICAGYLSGGRDTCQGDSGGGLICNNLLTGIVSFGYGCARPNFPGVYADVRVYNAFIDFAMNWNGGPQSAVPVPTTLRPSAASTTVISIYMFAITMLVLMVNRL